jgi:hypothetical protein
MREQSVSDLQHSMASVEGPDQANSDTSEPWTDFLKAGHEEDNKLPKKSQQTSDGWVKYSTAIWLASRTVKGQSKAGSSIL